MTAPPKITHLDGRDNVVGCLEQLLTHARAGKITAVAYAAQHDGDEIATGFRLAVHGNVWMLLGGLEELRYRILHEGCEQVVDDKDDGTPA